MLRIAFAATVALTLSTGGCKKDEGKKGVNFLAGEVPAAARPGGEGAGGAAAAGPDPAKFEGAGIALPRPGDVPGWRLKEHPTYHGPDGLAEVIDGAAAGYLAYGFVELARAEYAPPAGGPLQQDVEVEAYRMRTSLAAFGKYSEERASCDSPGKDPGPGCSRGSDRILHKGDWYVRVGTFDDTDAAQAELVRFGQVVARRTPGEVHVPEDAGRLPAEGRKANSLLYRPADLLGVPALGDGFSADYDSGGDSYSLFFKRADDERAARGVLAAFRKATAGPGFAAAGRSHQPVDEVGEDAAAVEREDGWTVVAQAGAVVAGAVECDTRAAAAARVTALLGAAGPAKR